MPLGLATGERQDAGQASAVAVQAVAESGQRLGKRNGSEHRGKLGSARRSSRCSSGRTACAFSDQDATHTQKPQAGRSDSVDAGNSNFGAVGRS